MNFYKAQGFTFTLNCSAQILVTVNVVFPVISFPLYILKLQNVSMTGVFFKLKRFIFAMFYLIKPINNPSTEHILLRLSGAVDSQKLYFLVFLI